MTSCSSRRPGISKPARTGRRRWSRSLAITGRVSSRRWSSRWTPAPRPGIRRCPARRWPTGPQPSADVLIPFGSVDPLAGEQAVRRARRLISEHGVRGFKFHPSLQGFSPDDRRYYPLYEVIEAAGLPAVFHTGQTGIGAGLPGGRGIKLRLSSPMLIDDVAADFPGLPVILAHPSVPWQDEAISIATHKANVFIDLS